MHLSKFLEQERGAGYNKNTGDHQSWIGSFQGQINWNHPERNYWEKGMLPGEVITNVIHDVFSSWGSLITVPLRNERQKIGHSKDKNFFRDFPLRADPSHGQELEAEIESCDGFSNRIKIIQADVLFEHTLLFSLAYFTALAWRETSVFCTFKIDCMRY